MAVRPDYRFCAKPRWILSHLFVLACVVAFVNLGFWQLRRLDERKANNATIRAAEQASPEALTSLLPAGPASTPEEADAVAYRPTTVSGTYRIADQVLVQNRTNDGQPGFWVLTPLARDDGTAVVVNRGWVPYATTSRDGPWPELDPPAGTVTVAGLTRPAETRSTGSIGGPTDAAEGHLTVLSRVDIARLQHQVDDRLYPVYITLGTQDPAQPGLLPVPVPPPELSEGPHLGYAGQWFIFATLTVIVYPLLLRRQARAKGIEAAAAATGAQPASLDGAGPGGAGVGPTGGDSVPAATGGVPPAP